MSIWHGVTHAVQAVVHSSLGRFVAGDLPMRCPHCQAEEFIEGSALLSTIGISVA
jgi:hypothetical protein